MNQPRSRIVLVEDNETDVMLVRRALVQFGIECELEHWADGEVAEAVILRWGDQPDQVPPSLVLLDLNLPRVDGFELLHLIRSRPQFDGIRVAILTSSRSPADMRKARDLGADAYIIKPSSLEPFLTEVGTMIRELLRRTGNRPKNHDGDAHAA
jgi:CheY-like chemotaxis protein